MSGASSFVHSTTAEAGNGMETRGRAVTNEIARNCFPLAFSFSGPQIKNPYISSIHKDFFHLLQPLYQGFKSGKRDSDPRPSAWEVYRKNNENYYTTATYNFHVSKIRQLYVNNCKKLLLLRCKFNENQQNLYLPRYQIVLHTQPDVRFHTLRREAMFDRQFTSPAWIRRKFSPANGPYPSMTRARQPPAQVNSQRTRHR